jgi:hypothetical protein
VSKPSFQKIEEAAAKGREESSSAVFGAAAVSVQKPFDHPAKTKFSAHLKLLAESGGTSSDSL